jgi:hypothetical protein
MRNLIYGPSQNRKRYAAMGRTRNAQAIKPRGEERMTTETQGKTEKDIINQDKKQTQSTELVSPKTGTATSSPIEKTTSPIFQCCWEMKKQGYARPLSRQLVND